MIRHITEDLLALSSLATFLIMILIWADFIGGVAR